MRTNRLSGHGLRDEGRLAYAKSVNGPGPGRCSCGEVSPELPNTSRRRQWHRDHKDDIRRGGDGKVWERP